ncbi:MAG: hypothetical protein A2057_06590 [Ignavibacteria bacterium GWA2_35_9]|nr:MAG: hypothetical protein A2057_06590 [Ignavibacteria bacterium GWA2_35_9]OGU48073.1 MAG: hypothetical protein A2000_14435 [Ignavibacteria bacterium GWB2_36_8]OGU48542.1 MAG: hypothetical protein A2080_07995 [Ignavibacteria bacterium GWC2_36_12]
MNPDNFENYLNKLLTFYSPEKAKYWNSLTRCCISEKPQKLGRYYLDFRSKIDYPAKFSPKGIPLFSRFNKPDIEHPIVIAQYAFGLYEHFYLTKFQDDEFKIKFLRMADWFIKNRVNRNDGATWLLNYEIPEYGLKHSWISAMAQGEAISVLTRAAILTQNSDYEKLSLDAIVPFKDEVSKGGLVNFFNSIPIYEEYPSQVRTVGVLNGFIFSLFGLYDLFLLNKNEKANELFIKGVDSLKKLLSYYDLKHWTRYYLYDYPKKYYSSFTYHILVAEQLKAMFYITGENQFKDYSEKWTGYSKSFIKKTRALFGKLMYANKVIP